MRLIHRWVPVLFLAATFAVLATEEPSPASDGPNEALKGEVDHPRVSDSQRLELATLDAEVQAKAALAYEASERVRLEQLRLDEFKKQQQNAIESQRLVQMQEARVAETRNWREIKQVEHEEARLRRDQARRRVEPPLDDHDEFESLRMLLNEEIELAEAQLQAREAQVKAMELLLKSETAGYRNYQRMASVGQQRAIDAQRAGFRLTEARVWRTIREAERDRAQVRLEQVRARLDQLESEPEPVPRPMPDAELDPAALLVRLQTLEREVESLREESAILKRWIQLEHH